MDHLALECELHHNDFNWFLVRLFAELSTLLVWWNRISSPLENKRIFLAFYFWLHFKKTIQKFPYFQLIILQCIILTEKSFGRYLFFILCVDQKYHDIMICMY
jgi:hypothetical protein